MDSRPFFGDPRPFGDRISRSWMYVIACPARHIRNTWYCAYTRANRSRAGGRGRASRLPMAYHGIPKETEDDKTATPFGQASGLGRAFAWAERFWPTTMIPGRGSDVRSSGHRPCPGEQALPRRHALLPFPLRALLLFCKPLSADASVHPRGHRTCLAHTDVYGVAV